jgi:hypothetical protein
MMYFRTARLYRLGLNGLATSDDGAAKVCETV